MKTRNLPLGYYDTILVDEAQDMKNWALEMLAVHTKESSTVCIAAGSGQELYGVSAPWLVEFRDNHSTMKKRLRRNFRNTKPVFQLAQTVYEAKLEASKIKRTVKHITTRQNKADQTEIEFAREGGRFPALLNILEDVQKHVWEDDDHFQRRWHDHMVDQYYGLIKEQLESLGEDDRPLDLLVLVPTTGGEERIRAYEALNKLGVPFVDYTVSENRHIIARPEMVRLCTYHSARGLEGHRVLLFGLENLDRNFGRANNFDKTKILYIALSRATFETMICLRRSVPSTEIAFIEECLLELKSG